MRARPTRLRGRDLAPLTVVVALLGALAAGCGSGSEKLSLSLSLSQQICETGRGYEEGVVRSELDADGNRTQRTKVFGWSGIPSLPVTWRVSGGQAPYSLVIDGESGYRDARYIGASGTAPVGCADTSSGTSFLFGERLYAVEPQVDSGWKTVRAVVTDANGDTAEATVEFYVLLSTGDWRHVLRGGETYRVFGHLMTIPEGIDLRIADHSNESEGPNTQSFAIVGTGAYISLNDQTYEEVGRWLPEKGAQGAAEGVDLDAKLDELADSIGQLPNLNRSER